MFTSIVLHLRPTENCILPPFLGHFAYSAILNLLPKDLASRWHEANTPKPFTISSILNPPRSQEKGIFLEKENEYFIRLTLVNQDEFGEILSKLWQTKKMRLGTADFFLKKISTQPLEHPQAFFLTHDEWERKAKEGKNSFEMEFVSPTAFRSGEKKLSVLPDPMKIFSSLSDRSEKLGFLRKPDLLDFTKAFWVSRLDNINTRVFEIKQNFYRGFMGKVYLELQSKNEEWKTYLWKLAFLAPFIGVGTKTAMGMGQVRKNF